jgi:hypothetical protein
MFVEASLFLSVNERREGERDGKKKTNGGKKMKV